MPTDAGDTFNTSEDSMTDDTRITDSERDLLRFPGDAPGLLRRGSPVHHARFGAGIMLDPEDDVCPAVFERVGNAVWSAQDLRDAPGLLLDLTDATGRAHMAWWIARELRATIYEPPESSGDRGQPAWVYAAGPRVWSIEHVGHSFMLTRWAAGWDEPVIDLDPEDPRLLPDGSRLVDALALSLVGRHLLAGGGR